MELPAAHAALIASLKMKGLSICDTSVFGFFVGHLMDHGATRTELQLLLEMICEGIEKAKANPNTMPAFERFAEAAGFKR